MICKLGVQTSNHSHLLRVYFHDQFWAQNIYSLLLKITQIEWRSMFQTFQLVSDTCNLYNLCLYHLSYLNRNIHSTLLNVIPSHAVRELV